MSINSGNNNQNENQDPNSKHLDSSQYPLKMTPEDLAKLVEYSELDVESVTVHPDGSERASSNFVSEQNSASPASSAENVVAQAELFEEDPAAVKTEHKFSNSAYSKLGLVAATTFAAFGIGGLFLSSVMSSGKTPAPVAQNPTPTPTPSPSVTPSPDPEVGKLKTEVALAQQESRLKSVEESKSPKTTVAKVQTPPKRATSTETQSQTRTSLATSRSTSAPPRYSGTSTPPRRSSPPVARVARANPTLSGATQGSTTPVASSRVQPSVAKQRPSRTSPSSVAASDPLATWQALNKVGSYGSNDVAVKTARASLNSALATNVSGTTSPVATLASTSGAGTTPSAIAMPRAIPVVSSDPSGGVPFPASPSLPTTDNVAQNPTAVLASGSAIPLPESGVPFPTQSPQPAARAEQTSIPVVNPEDEQSILNGTPIQEASPSQPPATPASTNVSPQATLAAQEAEPTASDAGDTVANEEQAFLASTSSRRLIVGAKASGKLISPAVWLEAGQSTQWQADTQQFVLQLTQPLTDSNGSISLPSGTEVVATVDRVLDSGVAAVKVSRLLIDGQEYVLPEGSLTIKGDSGQPLMASKSGDNSSEVASRDAGTFVLGSLAKVGEVLNRPEVETSTSSGGAGVSQTTISRSGSPNILGAVLQGGLEPLTQEMLRRNRQATSEAMNRPDTWYIPAGQNVQLVVARSFEF